MAVGTLVTVGPLSTMGTTVVAMPSGAPLLVGPPPTDKLQTSAQVGASALPTHNLPVPHGLPVGSASTTQPANPSQLANTHAEPPLHEVATPTQALPLQATESVHELSSLHAKVAADSTQPLLAVHALLVHGLPSPQFRGAVFTAAEDAGVCRAEISIGGQGGAFGQARSAHRPAKVIVARQAAAFRKHQRAIGHARKRRPRHRRHPL